MKFSVMQNPGDFTETELERKTREANLHIRQLAIIALYLLTIVILPLIVGYLIKLNFR